MREGDAMAEQTLQQVGRALRGGRGAGKRDGHVCPGVGWARWGGRYDGSVEGFQDGRVSRRTVTTES